jgi:holliday junction DNA helicase RuvA
MFSFIKGEIVDISHDSLEVECMGIGYKVFASSQTLGSLQVGEGAKVFTHMVLRENDVYLVGFESRRDMNLFKLLTSVSGVGPKVALSILSIGPSDYVARSIATGDTAAISKASGVGKRTSERIIIDLKDRIAKLGEFDHIYDEGAGASKKPARKSAVDDTQKEAFDALIVLGYSKKEVDEVLGRMDTSGLDIQSMIKEALRSLSR